MSQSKALDRLAVGVLLLCLAAAAASYYARSHWLHQGDSGLKAVARDVSGHAWLVTQRHLFIADTSGELRGQAALKELDVRGVPSDLARVGDEIWLLTAGGTFHACTSTPAPRCRRTEMPVHPQQGSLTWLAQRGEVVVVDRTRAEVHTVLLNTRVLSASSEPSAGLVRPGKPLLTDSHLVLPNTAASALVGWPLPAAPHLALSLAEPPERLLSTQGQPGFAQRAADASWLVLEAPTALAGGGLVRYPEGGARKPVGLRLKDPVAMLPADGGQVWIAGLRDRDVVSLDADGQERGVLASSTQSALTRVERTGTRALALARYALAAMVTFLVLPFAVLWGMGYSMRRSAGRLGGSGPADLPATTGFTATMELGLGAARMPNPTIHIDKALVGRSRRNWVIGLLVVLLAASAAAAFGLHDLRAAGLALIPALATGVAYWLLLRHLREEPDELMFVVEGLMVRYGERRTLLPYSNMYVAIEGQRRLVTRLNNRSFQAGRGALLNAQALDVPRLIALTRMLVPASNISAGSLRYWFAALRRLEHWALLRLASLLVLAVLLGGLSYLPRLWA